MQRGSRVKGRWQLISTPWPYDVKLQRLRYIDGRFYVLHIIEGLFCSTDGVNWTSLRKGIGGIGQIFFYDFDICNHPTSSGQYAVFLATSWGVYRSRSIHPNSEFTRASNGLPSSPNGQVLFISGTDAWDGNALQRYLICGNWILQPAYQPLYISSYNGDSWVPACQGYPSNEERPREMILNKYGYIITQSGKIYTCSDAYLLRWSLNAQPTGVICFGTSGAWGFVSTKENEFWKVHFTNSFWTRIDSNMDRICVALSSSQHSPLLACFLGRGIRRCYNWSSTLEWDDAVNQGFPQYPNSSTYQDAFLIATTEGNETICAAVFDETARRCFLYRFES